MVTRRSFHHALGRDSILRALCTFYGVTTANGNVGGTTLICDALIGSNDFISNKTILLQSGDAIFEHAAATAFNPVNGQITVGPAFSSQVLEGIAFYVLNLSSSGAVGGFTPVEGPITANWNSGVATSGNPGADLVTVGGADINHLVHSLLVNISNFTLAATATVRLYMMVNGVEREVYNETFTVGTDPNGVWAVNGTVGIHEALRCEVHSSNPADDGAVVNYDYMLE